MINILQELYITKYAFIDIHNSNGDGARNPEGATESALWCRAPAAPLVQKL